MSHDTEPQSMEAEQGVIGALLADNGIFSRLPSIQPDHFHNPVHKKLFEDISKTIGAGSTADAITLKERYDTDEFKDIGGSTYLADLIVCAPSGAAAPAYAKLVMEMALRRAAINSCKETIEGLSDPDSDSVYGLIDDHISDVVRIQRAGTGQQSFATTSDAVAALFSPDRPAKIDTGYAALDKVAGFARGGITLIGGRASMGKSAFLIECAFNAARRGLRVDLFSMEMNRAQIAARAISSHMARTSLSHNMPSSIPYQDIYEQNLVDSQWGRVRNAAHELPSINFDDTPRLTVSDIKARCIDKPGQLDLVFIDYLNIMDLADCKQADRHDQKLGLAAARLRDFAKDTGAAVILLCQLNRGNTSRDNNVPQLHDLRDSGELEQHADTVMFVHRQHYYLKREIDAKKAAGEFIPIEDEEALNRMEHHFDVIVAKQRMGATGKALLKCFIEFNYIGDNQK